VSGVLIAVCNIAPGKRDVFGATRMSSIARQEGSTSTTPSVPFQDGREATKNRAPRWRGVANWMRRSLGTLLVMGGLAGIALWGHTTDWTVPKYSAIFGGPS